MNHFHQESEIFLGAPGEEISIQDLQKIKQRFRGLNQLREQRAREMLQPRQRVFLDLLPLLFHNNFSVLPGFISSTTPAGIAGYAPNPEALAAAKQLAKKFEYSQPSSRDFPIEGLFIMGSVGSIAFSKKSDMDIWLCHQLNSDEENAINELQKKATAIEIWAASLGLEIHFFLMNSRQFLLGKNQPISKESSGQTQHYLLLEEFYRTAIYIAGKSPAWWFVPPHQEYNYSNYVRHLVDKLFIPERELIDFGGFDAVPAEEFIGATLWHLYKALHAPHKSLLKLLLMECYASEYPQVEWVCQDIKKVVYQGSYLSVNLDPYLLIYQKVERYLRKAQSHGRLTLARQCFCLKVMGATGNIDVQAGSVRENFLAQVAEQWDWPKDTVDSLKLLRLWNVKKATAEHIIVLQQLTQCYRMIMGFAKQYVGQNLEYANDLKLIGRKLQSFLEKRPGKVEIITTRFEIHAKENTLSIVESCSENGNEGWGLYLRNVQMSSIAGIEPIHKSRSLIEIFCWLIINGLYHKQLQLQFSARSKKMANKEIHETLSQLNSFLTRSFNYDPPLESYQSNKEQLDSLIIINMGDEDTDDLFVVGDRSDILSYGADHRCLVQTVNRISLSSWGEIITCQDEGVKGLFDCLVDIINNSIRPLSLVSIKFICHSTTKARAIISRLETLLDSLVNFFAWQPYLPRYVLVAGQSYYVFHSANMILAYKELANQKLLLAELSRPQERFSSVHFEPFVLENTPIPLIFSLNRPQVIQVFFYEAKADITIYIIDERGSLYIQQHGKVNPHILLRQYALFLESILSRNLFETYIAIEYCEILSKSGNQFSYQPVELKPTSSRKDLCLRITGEDTHNGIQFTIYCNEKEFSSLDYGNQIFYAAYQYIIEFRQSEINYPVHITDIDLPLSAFHIESLERLQTIHYLNYKKKIEDKFNVGLAH